MHFIYSKTIPTLFFFLNRWPLCISSICSKVYTAGGAQHISPLSTPRLRPCFPHSKWNKHRHAARHNPCLFDFFTCFTAFARSWLSHWDPTGGKLMAAVRSFASHSILMYFFIYVFGLTVKSIHPQPPLTASPMASCVPLQQKSQNTPFGQMSHEPVGGNKSHHWRSLLSGAIKNLLKISAKEACMIHWSSGWLTFCWAVK